MASPADNADSRKKKRTLKPCRSTDGLHNPGSSKILLDLLAKGADDTINDGNPRFDDFAPLYSIIMSKRGRERFSCVLTLLVHSKADPNLPVDPYATVRPLHTLAMYNDIPTTKAMIAFGGNLNQANSQNKTPLDIAAASGHYELAALLHQLGGLTSEEKEKRIACYKLPKLPSFDGGDDSGLSSLAAAPPSNHQLARQVEAHLERSFTASEEFPMMVQWRELRWFRRCESELEQSLRFRAKAGSRVLCLDGGGIRGLLQIEILMQIEEMTQRKITEIFDWIVGTSTGAIIALALVYGKKSLREIRQLYFQLKDRVFGRRLWLGAGRSGKELDKLLKETFGETMKMTDIQHPKMLVATVNKETSPVSLKFLNNCFTEDYTHPISDIPVWKAARYTAASPLHFGEQDNFVDGGVLANNPCDAGLTAIQEFHQTQNLPLSIAAILSLGSGKFPSAKHKKLGLTTFSFRSPIQALTNMLAFAGAVIGAGVYPTANARARCVEEDILFFRFDPELQTRIASDETDDMKLVDMIIETKKYMRNSGDMEEFVQILHQIANKKNIAL